MMGGQVVLAPSLRFTGFTSDVETPAGVAPPPQETDSASDVSPKLGGAWHVNERFTLRGNVGRFYRVPSLSELFGDAATIKGNGDLQPEEGTNADLGVTWQMRPRGAMDRLYVETVLFASDAGNLIQFVQTSQSQVIAQNTGEARIRGAELSLGLGMFGWLRGSVNYTFQDAEDRSDTFRRGDDLPGRPRHVVSARASAARAWGRPYYEFDYVGPNYSDTAGAALAGSGIPRDLIRIPGRYLHGLGYTQSAGRLEYTVEVSNIFDVKTVDIVRYPLPGRLVQASVRLALP
jgi:outer membrane receptor protein involved in Fe transport